MALKDWKKVTENNTFTTWQRKKEDMFLTITKQKYDPIAWGHKEPIDYIVGIGNHYRKDIEKKFKTKSQAIKSAKAYMRKH